MPDPTHTPTDEPWKGEGAVRDLVQQGDLAAAVAAAKQAVRDNAAEPLRRETLFNLMCLTGQWESAFRQAQTVGQMDPSRASESAGWQAAIAGEQGRIAVWNGKRKPTILGEPSEWVGVLAAAVEQLAGGNAEAAKRSRGEALDRAAEAVEDAAASGELWTHEATQPDAFAGWYDADDRLGPIIELFADGEYAWAPPGAIADLRMQPPASLRDLVWQPAVATWAAGGTTGVLLPVRYFGTEAGDADANLLLARGTEFKQPTDGYNVGVGQRLWITIGDDDDEIDRPLLSIGRVRYAIADDLPPVDPGLQGMGLGGGMSAPTDAEGERA